MIITITPPVMSEIMADCLHGLGQAFYPFDWEITSATEVTVEIERPSKKLREAMTFYVKGFLKARGHDALVKI